MCCESYPSFVTCLCPRAARHIGRRMGTRKITRRPPELGLQRGRKAKLGHHGHACCACAWSARGERASSYAARETEIKQLTADVILLDHLLDQYGKDAESGGTTLRRDTRPQAAPFKVASEGEAFYRQIQDLQPATDAQRDIKARLLQVTVDTPRRDSFFFRTWEARSQPPFWPCCCSGSQSCSGALRFWRDQMPRR